MGRITYFEFEGKKYPMSYSLMANKQIAKKFGTMNAFYEKFANISGIDEEIIDDVLFVLQTLMLQGAAYMNYYCKDTIPAEDADIVDGKYVVPDLELMEMLINMNDVGKLIDSILNCINGGSEAEIELVEEEGKNVESPKEE